MNLEKLQLVKCQHIKQFMRRFQPWLIVVASSFMAVEARAISATQFSHLFTTTIPFQTKQIVQASWECHGQQILRAKTCAGDGLEREEIKLYRMLNQYRAQKGLPPIPLSASLSLVANRHVRDLVENVAPSTYPHSWSNGTTGTPVVWLSDRTRPFVIVLIQTSLVHGVLSPLAHLGVGCQSRQDMDVLCEKARQAGLLVEAPKDSGYPVGYWAYLRDPDGHTLELSCGQEIGLTLEKQ